MKNSIYGKSENLKGNQQHWIGKNNGLVYKRNTKNGQLKELNTIE